MYRLFSRVQHSCMAQQAVYNPQGCQQLLSQQCVNSEITQALLKSSSCDACS
jgi:hypothetical protein